MADTLSGSTNPVHRRGYMMVLASTATGKPQISPPPSPLLCLQRSERAQELHSNEPPSNVSICSILDSDARPAMSMVKIVRGGQASFLHPQVGHETGEASLEALLFDVTNKLCGKRGERLVTRGEFEAEMRGMKEKALRLQREGVIS
jgi:hypothetical protein